MANAWTREPGITQGRIEPTGFVPPEGDFVFVLGRDVPGRLENLEVGDFVEIKQSADFGADVNFVRFRGRIRGAVTMPSGRSWKVSVLVNGVEQTARIIEPGRTKELIDMCVNVSKLTGDNELKFRLELI